MNMFSTASSRHPQLLHNITNWDKERTTEPCLHAPAVSLTLILPTDYCSLFKDIYYRFNNVHYSGSVIAARVTFIFCYYWPNIGDGKVDTSLEDRRQRWIRAYSKRALNQNWPLTQTQP